MADSDSCFTSQFDIRRIAPSAESSLLRRGGGVNMSSSGSQGVFESSCSPVRAVFNVRSLAASLSAPSCSSASIGSPSMSPASS
eukprot:6236347-Alexandrium_andersonii.AAC.1